MTEALVLALGVPTALVAAWLLWRRSWSQAFADIRGIALQTVIIIVVMLVIAGGIAGVLLSRGSDVMGELEAQDVTRTVDTASECLATAASLANDPADGAFTPGTSCVVTSTSAGANDTGDRFTRAQCQLAGGAFSGEEPGSSNAGASRCTWTLT